MGMRIASFGFRSLPPSKGSAGADKFALEFLPRLAERGHKVTGYNRLYPGQAKGADTYKGVDIIYFKTIPKVRDRFCYPFRKSYLAYHHKKQCGYCTCTGQQCFVLLHPETFWKESYP